jgi:hypothetical protein
LTSVKATRATLRAADQPFGQEANVESQTP